MSVEYRDIPGYPGYRVGDDGSVWSKRGRKDGKWIRMKGTRVKSGYLVVTLRTDNSADRMYIHRAVLLAFVGKCPEGKLTRHLDGNPENNVISNITYGTYSENAKDTVRHGRLKIKHFCGTNHPMHKLTELQVAEIRDAYTKYSKTKGSSALARKYNVSQSAIWHVIKGYTWRLPIENQSSLQDKT